MKFSIITPTYKRSTSLEQVVTSLVQQTYKDWELVIVNDSPFDESYAKFASSINDPRISYFTNERNRGVNYTRNFALQKISADSRWVIFLDDDDYFAPDTLATFVALQQMNPEQKWFITNRALKNGTPLTKFPKEEAVYNYAWEYLILKKCKGDATHCIETKTLQQHHITFSHYVKQGEEWFFFYQLGLIAKPYYHDHNSTITEGYNEEAGLNYRKRSFTEQMKTILTIFFEGQKKNILKNPSFILYILLRVLRSFIKRN